MKVGNVHLHQISDVQKLLNLFTFFFSFSFVAVAYHMKIHQAIAPLGFTEGDWQINQTYRRIEGR